MKKSLSVLLMVIYAIFQCLNGFAMAEQEVYQPTQPQQPDNFIESAGLEFKENGNGTCVITGIGSCNDADLVIPLKSPTGSSVAAISSYAFSKNRGLISVTIPSGSSLTIDSSAFSDCKNLENVWIWDSNVEMNSSAFSEGKGMTSLTIYGGEVEIGQYAFYKSDIQIVSIFNCNLTVDNSAFEYCDELTNITFNNCKAELDSCAFSECGDMATLVISGEEVDIGQYAFYKSDLTTVDIIADIVDIANSAFEYCELKKLKIISGEVMIGSCGFSECDALINAIVNAEELEIDQYGFYKCISLISVELAGDSIDPKAKITLGNSAFEYCSDLEKVVIGHGYIKLKSSVFSDCPKLSSLVMGYGDLKVASYALYNCAKDLMIVSNGQQYSASEIDNGVSFVPTDNLAPMAPSEKNDRGGEIQSDEQTDMSAKVTETPVVPTETPIVLSEDTATATQYVGTWVIKSIYMDELASYSISPSEMGLDDQKIVLVSDGSTMLDMYMLALIGQMTNTWVMVDGCAYINDKTALPIDENGNITISIDGMNYIFERSE